MKDRIINFSVLKIGSSEYGYGFALLFFGTLKCYMKSLLAVWYGEQCNRKGDNSGYVYSKILLVDILYLHFEFIISKKEEARWPNG